MLEFISFAFLALISGVISSPKINVYTTTYENRFKILENPSFPYDSIDINPTLGNIIFLIVDANDYTEITKHETLEEEYRDLENKIEYNHKAHLALIGCSDIGPRDLYLVDDFIKESGTRKIRTFGYGIFDTNYTIKANLWIDEDVDLLLSEFLRMIHGTDYSRIYTPNEYITIFDANPPLGRLESYVMNTLNGRFESKIVVTFILIGGDKMDEFLQKKHHKELLLNIVANEFGRFGLVFLMGCYNFRTHFYLIADVIEQQKALLVENYRGPMKNESIHVHVQGRGIWSSDFIFYNKSTENVLISNIDYPALDPFLDFYYEKTSKHTEYAVYDYNLNCVKQLGFEYINGEYRPHGDAHSYIFDTYDANILKIMFITKKQFENAYTNKGKFKQLLKNVQVSRHKVYLVVCYAEISTYPNVMSSMLEIHLGNYLKKNVGEVWVYTPKTIGPIVRDGHGGQFKEWPYKPIEDIWGSP